MFRSEMITDSMKQMIDHFSIHINTARGGLFDENTFIAALPEAWIVKAASDVLEEEPQLTDIQLIDLSNLYFASHNATACFMVAERVRTNSSLSLIQSVSAGS